ncbi:MAG: hypothetical protein QXK12_06425 [Candidatus Nezhaarchaeales archaeon]
MPKEVFSKEELLELSKRAIECRIKRLKDVVKLKLRTKRYLYTLKVKPEDVESLIKDLKCPIVDLSKKAKD